MQRRGLKEWENAKYYKILKDKADGVMIGQFQYPALKEGDVNYLPEDVGNSLVAEGYAKENVFNKQEVDDKFKEWLHED